VVAFGLAVGDNSGRRAPTLSRNFAMLHIIKSADEYEQTAICVFEVFGVFEVIEVICG
jgi:hypothetical protein